MSTIKAPTRDLYEEDFAAWAFEQAELVKRGEWDAIDVPNIVEELESMGRQQRAELHHRLALLLAHLAKWERQPLMRAWHGNSWVGTIEVQRVEIARHMKQNPSLKPYVPEAMASGWKVGRLNAAKDSGQSVKSFPEQCPYTWEQAMQEDWLPE